MDLSVAISGAGAKKTRSRCIGYGALSIQRPGVVASIYTYGESVYGFALTRPSEPVCQ